MNGLFVEKIDVRKENKFGFWNKFGCAESKS